MFDTTPVCAQVISRCWQIPAPGEGRRHFDRTELLRCYRPALSAGGYINPAKPEAARGLPSRVAYFSRIEIYLRCVIGSLLVTPLVQMGMIPYGASQKPTAGSRKGGGWKYLVRAEVQ